MTTLRIQGNVGLAPRVSTTPYGLLVHAHVAVYDRRDGVRRTRWVPVRFAGDLAEQAAARLGRGTAVRLEGTMRTQRFTGRDGQPCSHTRLHVSALTVLARAAGMGEVRPATAEEMAPAPAPATGGTTRTRRAPEKIAGHARWQVYGPGRSLRKRIWIAERRRDDSGRLVAVR